MTHQNTNSKSISKTSSVAGLPSDEALRELAKTYLEEQHRHFPEYLSSGLLPELSETSCAALASQFSEAYRSGSVQSFAPTGQASESMSVAACYVRYSDNNSNTRSLDQQLINVLKTARRLDAFIPWERVFADAAISGTMAARPGYQLLRNMVASTETIPELIFVDELDRLHRDSIEANHFSRILESRNRRLMTTNGFDSTNEFAKVAHAFSSLQSEMYIDQLKVKVGRGMTDAHKNGKHVAAPPTGYKLVECKDAEGKVIINSNSKVQRKVAIDEEAAEVIQRIFDMYANQKLSPAKIARTLDHESALGRSTWSPSGVTKMLQNEKYIGQWKWKTTTRVQDPITGKRHVVPVPEQDHLVEVFPERRIISQVLWDAAVARREQTSRKTNPPKGKREQSRHEVYPNMLFDLWCDKCDAPLRRFRSSGTYVQMNCPHGKDGLRGCDLKSSKSLRIIEECLLTPIKQLLFADDYAERLCTQANKFLVEEASKPPVDTKQIERKIATLETKLRRNGQRLSSLDDGAAADSLLEMIQIDQSKLTDLKAERSRTTKANFRPEPLKVETIQELLANLRELLNDNVVAAHEILAKLVGRVRVSLGEKQGRTHTWQAKLDLDSIPALVEIGKQRDCPTTHSLEFLRVCSWTMDDQLPLTIVDFPNYQRIAADVIKLHAAGSPVNRIAVALKSDPSTVKKAVEWAANNDASFIPPADFSVRRKLANNKTAKIGPDVVRLRNQGLAFEAIAKKLGTTGGTASRAYKQYHAKANLAAVEKGERLDTGKNKRKISSDQVNLIRTMLAGGEHSQRAIAKAVGVSPSTVRDEIKRMATST
ncbi:helix-turn-helix domain-containing protein [Rhodopirellula sp. JC740]|uniref:Helix-turn-helix domain-containing protein n=1 Tax=Rhodopirellula halodulae TaxID=2894198 RepID=A0ABS8NHG4_9BACT|nr:helix-turn-helix domain-containing protein [Rhodopirellula sp. JC740]MCC9642268.1 helix-turn-helix domain-containing protein [Rhodopirellula sp. JC740]